jgi:hypothetical protein
MMNTNLMTFDFASLELVAVVPVIVAIVQALKMVGLPSKFAPLVSIGVGILVAFLFGGNLETAGHTLLAGVLYGLSSSGLYSGTKTTAHAIKSEPENGVK